MSSSAGNDPILGQAGGMIAGVAWIDRPRSGIENMAIDQTMLQRTAQDRLPRLRFYQWDQPTVSLGYFQKFGDYQKFPLVGTLPVVRRATGGGAIVHHHDWTYSLTVPAELRSNNLHKATVSSAQVTTTQPSLTNTQSNTPCQNSIALNTQPKNRQLGAATGLYECIHLAVAVWLQGLHWDAGLYATPETPGHVATGASCGPCRFLCFERRHAGDVVVGANKVMGSAQRRLSGALLQHGSLLLAMSPFAPSLPGLEDLTAPPRCVEFAGWVEAIVDSLLREYRIMFAFADRQPDWISASAEDICRLESPPWIGRI
ncbi:MAG: hypothetical protein KF752_18940 [Pirellulaceae bacterium]|nr:hypothetical protein [Pirellulaceae bacterium]